jgi:predicted RNA binding protein YcfA (HicA-like mRNA interferase family)
MYAPVSHMSSFQLVLALAACNGWPVDAFDFDSAFLNGVLGDNEVVYLEQPADQATANRKEYIFWLQKALYGLKQGVKNWYDALCKALKDLGFERSEADHRVFFEKEDGKLTIIVFHVDNCITTGTSAKHIAEFKANINKIYSMMDLGLAHWILSIKVTHNLKNHTLSLSQHSYINLILT